MIRAPTCILLNSVQQVMPQMTIGKVNVYSRNFFHIVNKKGKFYIVRALIWKSKVDRHHLERL